MSILIKGMEMPTSCENCRFRGLGGIALDETVCMFTGNHRKYPNIPRFIDCPLVEIPPHGDLIDRDAYEYPGDLMDEPVIIEAEEGE